MSKVALLNLPWVMLSMWRNLAMSWKSSTGWLTSRRMGGLTWLMSSKLGLGPTNDTKDMTMASRIGSMGGLVTWANNCLK